jgi:Uma2 family endonuclease
MSVALPTSLTAADYYDLPEGGPRFQLIEGELWMSPSPNRQHQKIITNLLRALSNHVCEHDLGEVYAAPFDVEFDEQNVFQPDLSFFSHAREQFLTEQGASGAPDFVIEILSPSNAKFDLHAKRLVYARAGVREYWIVDPVARSVTVHWFEHGSEVAPAVFTEATANITARAVPGFAVTLSMVFEN